MPTLTRRQYKIILERRLTPCRLVHSLNVERAAVRLAVRHGADWQRAGLAGLLHDICRDDPLEGQKALLQRNGIRLDAAWLAHPPIWHGPCGGILLRELGLRDKEILRAVAYHTTCRPGMSQLEKVVCLADAISADRRFPGVEALRELAFADLDAALRQCLADSIIRIANSGRPLVRETWLAYNEYSYK